MKISVIILLYGLIFLNCNSKEKTISEKEENPTSRILNQDLKEFLPILIQIHNQTYQNISHHDLNFRFLISENFLYAFVSKIDCEKFSSVYTFDEKIGNYETRFYVYENSFESERYFDLKNLHALQNEFKAIICDDFYYLNAKFRKANGELKLEKINTIYTNDNEFLDQSDLIFLKEIGFIIEEPEPTTE